VVCFVVHEKKEKFFLLKSHDGLEMAALLHQRCLILPYAFIKAIISILLSQEKEAYIIKEAAGYHVTGKRAKISITVNARINAQGAYLIF